MKWKIDTPLSRFGYADDEKAEGLDAPDWTCWLVTRDLGRVPRHMQLQFPRPGIDRKLAEEIVQRVLKGLNS